MSTWTDKNGNTHVITRDGSHYVLRGNHYVKVRANDGK